MVKVLNCAGQRIILGKILFEVSTIQLNLKHMYKYIQQQTEKNLLIW